MENKKFINFLRENQICRIGGGRALDKESLKRKYPYNNFDEEWKEAIKNKQIKIIALGGRYAELLE